VQVIFQIIFQVDFSPESHFRAVVKKPG